MTFSIKAEARTAGNASDVRSSGLVPGVVYGGDRATPVSVSVKQGELEKLYSQAGESSLIDLTVTTEGTPVKALIQEVQMDPVRGVITHVDFRQIKMNEEMTVSVELNFVGEAGAVKALGGTLMKAYDTVTVTCLPKDLVNEINVDLTKLETFDDAIRVSDLALPAGIRVAEGADTVLAKVTPPMSEEEIKAMEAPAAVDLSKIEVEKKGKKEEEEAAAAAAK